jgi:NADPH:quinone reductase-like Zn-dependent oxidoreductase
MCGALRCVRACQTSFNGFDVILDLVGGETLNDAATLANSANNIVSIVDTPQRGQFHFVSPNGSQLAQISKLYDSGDLQVPEIEILKVTEAAKAMVASQGRKTRGKIVLKMDF